MQAVAVADLPYGRLHERMDVGALIRSLARLLRHEGRALLVPGAAELEAAGDEWNSETLPLFTCLSMSQPAAAGSGCNSAGHGRDHRVPLGLENSVKKNGSVKEEFTKRQISCCDVSKMY